MCKIFYTPRQKNHVLLSMVGFLAAACLVYLKVGAAHLDFEDVWFGIVRGEGEMVGILRQIRLPRLLLVVVVGAGLGVCGASLQTLFQNPLADPSLLGVSSGAALGVVASVLWASPGQLGFFWGRSSWSLLGALAAAGAVYAIAKRPSWGLQTSDILLGGIAINTFSAAGIGLFTMFSSGYELQGFMFWMLGSFSTVDWGDIGMVIFVLPSIALLLCLHRSLDLWLLGEDAAFHLGCRTQLVKTLLIGLTALIVGASVAVCGIIGFVGLLSPHIARWLLKDRHIYLLSGSAMMGALLLVLSDMLARTVMLPGEVLTGIITALIGSPFFLFILLKRRLGG